MKCLILGDGKLGTELHAQTNWDYISRKKDYIDFLYPQTYVNKLHDYDVIINCIGYTKTYENEKELNWNINYLGVIDLANICNENKKKLVQISTDYVYANSGGNSSENDIPVHFKSWYSYTKLLADGYIQAVSKNYLLIRTNFKPYPFPWKNAWGNITGNFDYVHIISKLIVLLIAKDAKGVYNVGTKPKTYYELAIKSVPDCIKDDSEAFNHPHDVTMNLSKLHRELNV
jgi:nucleoside-diphosphate-sugar epimerase